jgi:hypothetical protein
MKQKFLVIYLVVFILTACNSNSKQSPIYGQSLQENISLPKTFYRKFIGTFGNNEIVLDLTKNDSILTGQYYLKNGSIPKSLNGHIGTDLKFKLSETNNNFEEVGNFSGSFINSSVISGTWTDKIGKQKIPFNLSEKTDNIVQILFEKRQSKNCKNAEKNKKQPSDDPMPWDTLCTTIDLDYITVKLPSLEASKKVNDTIMKILCNSSIYGNQYSTLEALMNSVDSVENGVGFEMSIGAYLITNDNNIICISIGESFFDFGAAHPQNINNLYNFDIRTGNLITLDDILIENYAETLNKIGEIIFIETNGSEGWQFEKGSFELNRDFAITPGGLLFSYDQYEIGVYAAGAPEVFIPYKDINNLIKPNGLLNVWRK